MAFFCSGVASVLALEKDLSWLAASAAGLIDGLAGALGACVGAGACVGQRSVSDQLLAVRAAGAGVLGVARDSRAVACRMPRGA